MKIIGIERIGIDMPYKERVREHLQKGWGLGNRSTDEEFEREKEGFYRKLAEYPIPRVRTNLYIVKTDDGLTGIGEGVEALADEALAEYSGRNPFEFIMDDDVGPLQIAFYDLMGQALELPIARLLGPARERAALAWWSQCFPPEVLREEARLALELGFCVHKFKRRAHTDVVEQVAAIAEVAPDDYEVTADANQTFGTRDRALAIGRKLIEFPQLHCLESPIDQDDVEGYCLLKAELGVKLAHHMGRPDPLAALQSGAYDYFILGTRVAATTRNGAIAAAGNRPFWMQATDTDISALFMLHLAAATPNATLAHVSTHHLNEVPLLEEPITVADGQVTIPTTPGLGVGLDMDAVDRYRI